MLSGDREHLRGWVTRHGVLVALANSVEASERSVQHGALAADFADGDPEHRLHQPSAPLDRYEIVELSIGHDSPAADQRIGEISWPTGSIVVAVTDNGRPVAPQADTTIKAGQHIILLSPATAAADAPSQATIVSDP